MLTKRIIPCLDVTEGRVVKGVNFVNLIDAGDPVEVARRYNREGADEICFLDITATSDNRDPLLKVIESTAAEVFIPLTVGGGIRVVEDMGRLLSAGADKGSVNSAALQNPDLIGEGAVRYGSQFVVVAIDARRVTGPSDARPPQAIPAQCHLNADSIWEVYVRGGREPTGVDAVAWARYASESGCGEILLTSMDGDGTKNGYDLPLTRAVADAVSIPVIASGGVGNPKHFVEGYKEGGADACLAASVFHFGEYSIAEVKKVCQEAGIPMRIA